MRVSKEVYNRLVNNSISYKESKYHNTKTYVNGIAFDSKLEANRYEQLKLLEKVGVIKDLVLQPEFELIPKFTKNNKTYRKTSYIADFMYFDTLTNKTIVEDAKGFKTDVYTLKKKMFEYKYKDLEIKEIKKNY